MATAATLGTLTIGQAPRADIGGVLGRYLPRSVRRIDRGVLDGLDRCEIDARYAATPGEPALITRLHDGTAIEVSRRRMQDGVQQSLFALEDEGCDVVLVLCVGTFAGLETRRAWLVEPDRVIPGMVAGLLEQRRLGVIVPIAGQVTSEREKWHRLAHPPLFGVASPYDGVPGPALAAANELKTAGAGAILLDCIGFTEDHRAALGGIGVPVMLSNAIAAKAVAELLGG